MEFLLLGLLEVRNGTQSIPIPRGKERALLAALLLRANEPVPVEALVDRIWGEQTPAKSAKTVQIYVSRLRKLLGPGRLATTPAGYVLRAAPGEVDAERFGRLAAEGRAAFARGDPRAAEQQLEGALALWRGDALGDFRYEPFAQEEIRRLEELRLEVRADLVDTRLALGRSEELLGEIGSLVTANPVWERPRAQLMLALYRGGRQAEALQAYQEARNVLVDGLGIEPSRALRELEQAILRQDDALETGTDRSPAPDAAQPDDLVGRVAELAVIRRAIDDAAIGRGRLILVTGEPGVGKSRLLEESARLARARGLRLLLGRAWEAGGAPAFWPWLQALRKQDLFADGDDPDTDEDVRFRAFERAAGFLEQEAARQPLLLLLDDMHVADRSSLLLLQFVTQRLKTYHVLALASFRDVDTASDTALLTTLAELAREPAVTRMQLGGLSEEDVAAYVELTLREPAPELAAAVHARTDGNALFVTETVRLLAETPAAGELPIPPTVRDAVALRLERLSPACRHVLVGASILGRDVLIGALRRLVDVDEESLLAALDEAFGAGMILAPSASEAHFRHVLLRDGLYDSLSLSARVKLHRRALEALEQLYGDDLEPHLSELAHHAAAAGDRERVLHYSLLAGDRALHRLAYEEASRLYRAALESGAAGGKERCDLLLRLGDAEHRSGDGAAAKAAFLAAAELAERNGLATDLARAAAGYGGGWMSSRAGGDPRLVPLLEEALDRLGDRDVELRARLLARLAGALRDEPSRERRDRVSREAVELATRSGEGRALAYALDGRMSAIDYCPDTLAEIDSLAHELIRVGGEVGDDDRVLHGHIHRLFAAIVAGDVGVEADDLEHAAAIAARLRRPADLWQVAAARAMLALAGGRFAEAEALIAEAAAPGTQAQPDMAVPINVVQRYTLADVRNERLDGFEAELEELIASFPARPVFRCVLAHLYARSGRDEEAATGLVRLRRRTFATIPFDAEWLFALSLLAETAVAVDDVPAAGELHGLLLPWQHLIAADPPEGIRGSVAHYLGLLAAARGRVDAAERHLEAALAVNRSLGYEPWAARTEAELSRTVELR